MDLAGVALALSQSSLQQNLSVAMLKANAQEQQSIATMVQTAVSNLGQNLDIHI